MSLDKIFKVDKTDDGYYRLSPKLSDLELSKFYIKENVIKNKHQITIVFIVIFERFVKAVDPTSFTVEFGGDVMELVSTYDKEEDCFRVTLEGDK